MQNEFDFNLDIEQTNNSEENSSTIYGIAMNLMKSYIDVYLNLAVETNGFAIVEDKNAQTYEQRLIILAGINSQLDPNTSTSNDVVQEWQRRQALIFDVEESITKGVYLKIREVSQELINKLRQATNNFQKFDASYIYQNPQMLPIFQRLIKVRSKSELKKRIGSVSDNSISKPAAEKLSKLLENQTNNQNINDSGNFARIRNNAGRNCP